MLSRTRSSSPRTARFVAAAGVVVTLGVAAGVVLREPWHGPVILSLSTGHGIHAGNLAVAPLVALAILLVRCASGIPRSGGHPVRTALSGRWVAPASAIVLGLLLLAAAAVELSDRGPLVPTGGGTFDGKVRFLAARSDDPVGSWSYVAVTYDGSILRMFVNGDQVASQPTTGAVKRSGNPLWLGGNHPYGEYFDGLIDEARVYDRALTEAEIRADMETPVATGGAAGGQASPVAGPQAARLAAAGPVAAYSFDEGTGSSLGDGSGNGNVGTVSGATWSQGRYGTALRFNGADDVVRVPPSTSLDVGPALTLSAWIRPATSQGGWRTILHREQDAFFLDAGGDLRGVSGRVDDLVGGLVVVAAAWFGVVMVVARRPSLGRRRSSWAVAAGAFLVGCIVDAALAPSVSLFGPALLAVWLALSARGRTESAVGWALAAVFTALTAASLADVADGALVAQIERADGGLARSAALGATLLAIGLVMARREARSPTGWSSPVGSP
ncbi:MAG TPA: LamG domain-containing protein [Acidimicrobiales bacterium]|nr:LamG domain-containing protein [Acidimicrobiales bacterium]